MPPASIDFPTAAAAASRSTPGSTGANWKEVFAQRHPAYAENSYLWQYYLDCYMGGVMWPGKVNPIPLVDMQSTTTPKDAFTSARPGIGLSGQVRYLWQFPLEKPEKYVHRLSRAVYINILQPVADYYAATVGKGENVLLSNDPDYEWFEDDVDLQGTSFLQFMTQARTSAAIRGHTYLFMDSTTAAEPIVSQYDVKRQGVRPYLLEILPENLLNWRLDDHGQPLEILFRVEMDVPGSLLDAQANPVGKNNAGSGERAVQYRYWNRDTWQVYEQQGSGANITFKSQGTHALKCVPIIPLYHKRQSVFVGEGLLKDSAKIGHLLSNWVSALDEAFEVQMFAIPVWTSKVSPTDGGVGVTTVLHLNPDNNEKFEYVTPGVQPFEAGWDAFYRMLALANKQMGISPKAVSAGGKNDPQSGISKEWDFVETEKILCRMALNEQEAAETVFYLLGAWTGGKWNGSIQYAQNYDLSTAQDDINDLISLQSAGLPKTARQELMRRVIAKKMPNLPEDKAEAITQEIDALAEVPDIADQMDARNAGPPGAPGAPGEEVQAQPMGRPVDRSGRSLVAVKAPPPKKPPAA